MRDNIGHHLKPRPLALLPNRCIVISAFQHAERGNVRSGDDGKDHAQKRFIVRLKFSGLNHSL